MVWGGAAASCLLVVRTEEEAGKLVDKFVVLEATLLSSHAFVGREDRISQVKMTPQLISCSALQPPGAHCICL